LALVGALGFKAGLVQKQPEQDEVRVGFARHHRFEVELDVGLTGQADVIAQQPQAEAV
jgi:hypothetical protein